MPDTSPSLTPAELVRYRRHIQLPEIGLAGQERLARSRVLLVGAGGLGSPAALYLAAAGVGTLGIADSDPVEEHNLQRQILHDTAAIGRSKVESAAAHLTALNPHVRIVPHGDRISASNARELFAAYDVIVDGTDNFPTRYLNNDAAFFTRRPLVYGSVYRFEGQVSVFDPANGAPCYRCLFPEPPPPGAVPDCGAAGVLGALCGVIGSLQAVEAVKVLLDLGDALRGRLIVFDALTLRFRTLNLERNPACPLCGLAPRIVDLRAARYAGGDAASPDPGSATEPAQRPASPLEVSATEAHALVAAGEAALLDVREPSEHAICRLPGSILLPMGRVPQSLDQLPRDRPLLVLCHHGSRSLRVTRFLQAQGFAHARNIRGGIDAWSNKVDPSVRRY